MTVRLAKKSEVNNKLNHNKANEPQIPRSQLGLEIFSHPVHLPLPSPSPLPPKTRRLHPQRQTPLDPHPEPRAATPPLHQVLYVELTLGQPREGRNQNVEHSHFPQTVSYQQLPIVILQTYTAAPPQGKTRLRGLRIKSRGKCKKVRAGDAETKTPQRSYRVFQGR